MAGLFRQSYAECVRTAGRSLERQIDLDLKRKELENKLLARQIELLEKSQEYRCYPLGSEKPPETTP